MVVLDSFEVAAVRAALVRLQETTPDYSKSANADVRAIMAPFNDHIASALEKVRYANSLTVDATVAEAHG